MNFGAGGKWECWFRSLCDNANARVFAVVSRVFRHIDGGVSVFVCHIADKSQATCANAKNTSTQHKRKHIHTYILYSISATTTPVISHRHSARSYPDRQPHSDDDERPATMGPPMARGDIKLFKFVGHSRCRPVPPARLAVPSFDWILMRLFFEPRSSSSSSRRSSS